MAIRFCCLEKGRRATAIACLRFAQPSSDRHATPSPKPGVYTAMLGLPLGRQSRCCVAWYGEASLLPHLRQLVARGAIDVTVIWGDPVTYDEFSDRKAVARRL